MMRVVKQSRKKRRKSYMKLKKREIVEMLMNCHDHMDRLWIQMGVGYPVDEDPDGVLSRSNNPDIMEAQKGRNRIG